MFVWRLNATVSLKSSWSYVVQYIFRVLLFFILSRVYAKLENTGIDGIDSKLHAKLSFQLFCSPEIPHTWLAVQIFTMFVFSRFQKCIHHCWTFCWRERVRVLNVLALSRVQHPVSSRPGGSPSGRLCGSSRYRQTQESSAGALGTEEKMLYCTWGILGSRTLTRTWIQKIVVRLNWSFPHN